MDAPSPLSDLDNYEVVGDSEDEGGREITTEQVLANNCRPAPSLEKLQTKMSSVIMAAPIDYFAGFEEAFTLCEPSVLPSIAERAKMRQRKTTGKFRTDILELTDDEEFLEAQSNKHKKSKPKGEASKVSSEGNKTSSPGVALISRTTDHLKPPLINAKTKIRPRMKPVPPILSPLHDQTPQATIPVPTSTLPLPPSDPPMLSSSTLDKDIHVPPIEFLPPPQDDTDTPLPSSLTEENIDELQIHNLHHQSNQFLSLPPPPTFFAGSSSAPSVNPTILSLSKRPAPLPINAVDLTDLSTTAIASPVDMTNPNTSVKPRKPRRVKGKAADDIPSMVGSSRVNKKGKSKANQVTVHQPELELEFTMKKRNRKRKVASEEEDELNIQNGDTDALNTPVPGPFSLIETKESATADAQTIDHDDSLLSKSSKRKTKKRKDVEKIDGAPMNATSRKRKKTPDSIERQENGLEDTQTPLKNLTRKRKDEKLETRETSDNTRAVVKGKRRLAIVTDDEDGDTASPPVVEDAFPSSSTAMPDEHRNRKPKAILDGIEAEANYSTNGTQADRDVLKNAKPTESQTSSPTPSEISAPHKHYEMPSVAKYPSLSSRYTIAPKSQTAGMTELLRRVNSHPNSSFPPAMQGSPVPKLVYSPFLKSSRRTLSRIAPLHPHRKTPPPPLPPLPPRKKSKKELEMEEKWEEEIIEEIGGVAEWLALSEGEKKDLRRMKRDREMGYCED